MVVTSWLSVGYHLEISNDQVESRLRWVAGGSRHTFVAESPDECARAVMGVTPLSVPLSRFPALQNTTKIPREDLQEREERKKSVAGEGKNAKIWAPHRSGPHPSGPHPSGPHPSGAHPSGPHPSGAPPFGCPTLRGPHPSGPHPSGAHSSGPHPSGPLSGPPLCWVHAVTSQDRKMNTQKTPFLFCPGFCLLFFSHVFSVPFVIFYFVTTPFASFVPFPFFLSPLRFFFVPGPCPYPYQESRMRMFVCGHQKSWSATTGLMISQAPDSHLCRKKVAGKVVPRQILKGREGRGAKLCGWPKVVRAKQLQKQVAGLCWRSACS